MKEILELLQLSEWYQGDEFIQIAKGKYEYPSTFKGWTNKIIRKYKLKSK